MLTYQDFLEAPNKADFALRAMDEHKSSEQYRIAKLAQAYYRHENPTIMNAQKFIYNAMGKAVPDIYSANNKIPCRWYFYFITQAVQTLLGNGVSIPSKEKLGADFDNVIMQAATFAQNSGVSFVFYNYDHVEAWDFLEFVPLYDERTSELMAGVRFWQLSAEKPLMFTIYEPDGYTEYERKQGDVPRILQPKRSYKLTLRHDGLSPYPTIVSGQNYDSFPIVPLYNMNKQSELKGSQSTLDAYDLMASELVNNIDDGNLIYWVIKNCGGMSPMDDERFIEQLKMTHVVHADGDDGGASVDAHTVDVPFQASEAALERLRQQLFDDFMALDVKRISNGSTTATEIRAAYEPLNSKLDAFEVQVTSCILGLLKLAGVTGETPTYTRSKIVNVQEEVSTILQAANYLSSDYITRKILTILGDADLIEEVLKQQPAEQLERTPFEE